MPPDDTDAFESLLIYAASHLLGKRAAHGFSVRLVTPSREEILKVKPHDIVSASEVAAHRDLSHTSAIEDAQVQTLLDSWLSKDQQQILHALGEDEATAATLAERCHLECDTRFRYLMAFLVERGILLSGRNGYRIASPHVLRLLKRLK